MYAEVEDEKDEVPRSRKMKMSGEEATLPSTYGALASISPNPILDLLL